MKMNLKRFMAGETRTRGSSQNILQAIRRQERLIQIFLVSDHFYFYVSLLCLSFTVPVCLSPLLAFNSVSVCLSSTLFFSLSSVLSPILSLLLCFHLSLSPACVFLPPFFLCLSSPLSLFLFYWVSLSYTVSSVFCFVSASLCHCLWGSVYYTSSLTLLLALSLYVPCRSLTL